MAVPNSGLAAAASAPARVAEARNRMLAGIGGAAEQQVSRCCCASAVEASWQGREVSFEFLAHN